MKQVTFLLILATSFSTSVHSQVKPIKKPAPSKSYSLSVEDSLAIINELREELKLMFGSSKKSFGDISVGVGSGFFRPTNSQLSSTVVSRAIYNISGGYYHKSGFGVDARSLFLNDVDRFKMFQSSITPSYNYNKSKAFAAGINYSRYINGDSLSFSTSPLVNEWQVYGRLKKFYLQPSLLLNYAYGTSTDEIAQQGTTPAMTITENASDFGLMASIRHNYTWLNIFNDEDAFKLTPTLLSVAGTTKYGMNFAVGSISRSFTRQNVNPKKKVKETTGNGNSNGNGNGNGNGGGTTTTPTVEEDNYSTGFKLQSATFILGLEYSWKDLYIQPQYLLDYSFHASEKKWTKVFNISIGMTL